MLIRRATRSDLPQINSLLNTYGQGLMEKSHINHRDVCLVAVEGVTVQGVLWAGLMRQNKCAYLDLFTVDAKFSHQRVGQKLALELLRRLDRMGVQQVFGVIQHDAFHDRSAVNSLRMGLFANAKPYTFVYGFIDHIKRELSKQGASHGQ